MLTMIEIVFYHHIPCAHRCFFSRGARDPRNHQSKNGPYEHHGKAQGTFIAWIM